VGEQSGLGVPRVVRSDVWCGGLMRGVEPPQLIDSSKEVPQIGSFFAYDAKKRLEFNCTIVC